MSNNQNRNVTIGIDLGTTYCCVATYRNGKVIVISSDYGEDTTPSYLTIPDPADEVEDEDGKNRDEDEDLSYIGQASKDSAVDFPQQTIYNVKRLIGRKFKDPCVQRDMKFWPFEVTQDPSGSLSPFIKVNDKLYTPEELSAKILFHLKRRAQDALNCSEIKDVVITVPAYFNDGQRQATRDAGTIAGFNVLQIINEPTAAALAYNHHYRQNNKSDDDSQTKRNCLVFDLGGGTFDVSVLILENNNVRVLAVGGSTHLGGEDFDNAMVDHCLQEFKKEHNIDIHEIRKTISKLTNAEEKAKLEKKIIKSLRRLRNECERQKQYLSASADRVVITMDAFYEGHMLKVPIKRDLFEFLNKKHFTECMRIVEDVVKNSHLTKQDIDDIIMVGGSSRIPKIQKMLSELFGGKSLINRIDKDLAVAHGAAIQAATSSFIENDIGDKTDGEATTNASNQNHGPPCVTITDVVPLSIGVELDKILGGDNRNFDILIPKNTPIPHSTSKEFGTAADNVRSIRINIFEGESPFTQDNHHLGNFILTDLPRCPQGEPIVVTMGVDKEGILHVSAQLPKQKIQNQISITEHKGRLTTEQIEELKNRMKGKIVM